MQTLCAEFSGRTSLCCTAETPSRHASAVFQPRRLAAYSSLRSSSRTACWRTQALPQSTRWRHAQATYPTPETEKERSSLDYPQEWITPQPSRRPDPVPDFEKLETPKIRPLPGDPEQPDEEEEEEEEKKKKKEDDPDNPEKDNPDPSTPPE